MSDRKNRKSSDASLELNLAQVKSAKVSLYIEPEKQSSKRYSNAVVNVGEITLSNEYHQRNATSNYQGRPDETLIKSNGECNEIRPFFTFQDLAAFLDVYLGVHAAGSLVKIRARLVSQDRSENFQGSEIAQYRFEDESEVEMMVKKWNPNNKLYPNKSYIIKGKVQLYKQQLFITVSSFQIFFSGAHKCSFRMFS